MGLGVIENPPGSTPTVASQGSGLTSLPTSIAISATNLYGCAMVFLKANASSV
jgi:hypothetical protein